MKSWKKRLKDELNASAPALREEVLNAPLICAPENAQPKVVRAKKWSIFAGSGMAAALAIVFVVMGVLGVFSPVQQPDNYVFALDINPSVSFITDNNGVVLEVKSLNADADVIVSNSEIIAEVKNKPLSQAIVTYTDYAAKLGYLDVSAPQTAVRLSASSETDEQLLSDVSFSLSNYFKQNGIFAAVVQDVVQAKELGARLGVDASSLEKLTAKLKDTSDCFAERNIGSELTAEQLSELYNSFVVGEQLLQYVKNELLANIEKVTNFAKQVFLISQIEFYNRLIVFDADNPTRGWLLPIGDDYWTLKQTHPDHEFMQSEYVQKIEELIAKYEQDYGKLDSLESFESVFELLSSFKDFLEQIDWSKIPELSMDVFQASLKQFVGLLEFVGVDTTNMQKLLAAPQNVEQYVEQLGVTWQQVASERIESNKERYEASRTEISNADYDAFIEEIVQQYGSLQAFWQEK